MGFGSGVRKAALFTAMVLAVACGEDAAEEPGSSTAGSGGSSGSAGSGNTAGSAGASGGAAGSAGSAGSAGTSAAGGGSGGSAGSAGTGGTGGSGGGQGQESLCSDYCDLLLANCPTRYATDYTDAEDCRTQCAAMPLGTPAAQGGDTLWCRYNHADLAEGEGDVSVHCIHAGLHPPEVCNF